jgi:hypothetical protein
VNKQHSIFIVILLSCTFFATGCFDIVEDITIHNNGSGEFFYTVNLSQSKANLDILMQDDSSEGYRIPSRQEIDADIVRTKLTLEKQPGITAVVTTTDWVNYIFTLRFKFNTIQQLNAAVESVSAEFAIDHKSIPEASGNFAFAGKTFNRRSNYNAIMEREKLTPKDKEILSKASYSCIYRFDQAVGNSSNPKSKISSNGKSVMTRFNMLNLATGAETIVHTIQLK